MAKYIGRANELMGAEATLPTEGQLSQHRENSWQINTTESHSNRKYKTSTDFQRHHVSAGVFKADIETATQII